MNSKILNTIKNLTPPIVYSGLQNLTRPMRDKKHLPVWKKVMGGPVRDYWLYVSQHRPIFKDMILGDHDQFFWDFIDNAKIDLKSKTIIDIGGHIGYHSMCFSALCGSKGKVYVFEPNEANVNRMKLIFDKNDITEDQISVSQCALGNCQGSIEFSCSDNIDGGGSFGGYIEGSDVPLSEDTYKGAKFAPVSVKVETLDHFFEDKDLTQLSLIKIDVEGAEHMVLEGGKKIINQYKPVLFIEIHSVSAMMYVCEILYSLGYNWKILDEDEATASRCFIVAQAR